MLKQEMGNVSSVYKVLLKIWEANKKIAIDKYCKSFWEGRWRAPNIHQLDYLEVENMYSTYAPVFVLSTGRAGTGFLSELFSHVKGCDGFHEPTPSLPLYSNYAYHNQNKDEILKKMFESSRIELILTSYIKNRIYIETNQVMTFFAPQISTIFEKAKFIHLTRHPGDFIRSAIKKGWYENATIWERGRIKEENEILWKSKSKIEKLSWLWEKTNRFIEDFGNMLDDSRMYMAKVESLFTNPSAVNDMLRFIGAKTLKNRNIQKIQIKKVNQNTIKKYEPKAMKKIHNFPEYNDWDNNLKLVVQSQAGHLCEKYGYIL